ncbi:thiamine pyrophosphate-dependent enzyme, partial [Desulfovibrio sp. OttesenSCG-928-I05]|nr:thiamine pyrophosphate-dependent enzyme [Desulfovibrio sp. OttesenSCG-928-I05]
LRTTTRVSHLRGPVTYGPLPEKAAPVVPFQRDPMRFVPVPAVSRRRHHALVANLESARARAESSPWNSESGAGKFGIIASGMARAYLRDVLFAEGWQDDVRVLELGFSWPLPMQRIETFIKSVDSLLILEESEPLAEREIRAFLQERRTEAGLDLPVFGKGGPLTVFGEYSVPLLREALAGFLGKTPAPALRCAAPSDELPGRPPNLCAGCAHRAVYYSVRKVFGDDAIYSSDIGCYTLGMIPPLSTADFLFCMGSSISAGSGFARASGKTVLAFIGDSTFFHSGMTGLVNAVFNKHDLLVVILDNGTTAMTGHQPNPGVDQCLLGDDCVHLDIESVVRGCGVTEVRKVRPNNVKATMQALEDMKAKRGVRVIIAEEPCVLFARRALKKKRGATVEVTEQGAATQQAARELACPAFVQKDGIVSVDEASCAGCMVCLQLAPGFKARKKESA